MGFIEAVERHVRSLGRDVVPPLIKRQLWFQYMTVRRVLGTRSLDMPAAVQIEVNTNCNRACSYCSNSLFPKEQEYMDGNLYRNIIDELAEINFRGRISPHFCSEPLLHPELTDLASYARKAEKARIWIFTNGDFLDRRRFDELKSAGVGGFVITQHSRHAPQSLLDLLANLSSTERRDVTYQNLDSPHLFNMGIPGLIPPDRRAIPNPCSVADYFLQVLVNGDVAQCCVGSVDGHVFGNVSRRPLMDIWNNSTFKSFRREVSHGQFELDVCRRCVYDIEVQT